ncbi:MAG: formate dehydrogenase accessory sulfurtransferase FdhD, partial [Saprospiraceae bacterium]
MSFKEGIFSTPIIAIKEEELQLSHDTVSIEEPLEIILKYKEGTSYAYKVLSITMRTPGHDQNLAIGFLFNEGIIDRYSDIQNVEFRINCHDDDVTQQTIVLEISKHLVHRIKDIDRHFYTSSSCGVCGKTSIDLLAANAKYILTRKENIIHFDLLYSLAQKLREAQIQFAQTGGIHACGIFNLMGELVQYREDVGRHNALDKLIGWSLEEVRMPWDNHILLLSGRASFELIHKAICIGIPVVASVGAP